MEVRPAMASDADGIARAYLDSWRAAYEDLLTPDVLWVESATRATYDWASYIRSDADHVAVATDARRIVGVAQAGPPPGGERDLPEVTMLYVVPDYWGTPAGRELLAAASRWIAAAGWPAARLRVVEAQARARRFYEREGWQRDSRLSPAHNGLVRLVYYRRALAE